MAGSFQQESKRGQSAVRGGPSQAEQSQHRERRCRYLSRSRSNRTALAEAIFHHAERVTLVFGRWLPPASLRSAL